MPSYLSFLRRFLFYVLWACLLFWSWGATSRHFFHPGGLVQREILYQKHWDLLRKDFLSLLRLYYPSLTKVPVSLLYFWENGLNFLIAIRLQHHIWGDLGHVIPVGEILDELKSLDYHSILSSSFGKRRDPWLNEWGFHTGVDLRAKEGMPVYAAGDGIIIPPNTDKAYGRNIIIRHAYGFSSVYGHLSHISSKSVVGKRVYQGDVIGFVGTTGRTTGPHLHYEIRNQGFYLNPLLYLEWGKNLS